MLTYIIIGLVVVGVVGYLRALPKEDRADVIKASISSSVVVGTYAAKMGKDSVKMAYNTGSALANETQIHGQDTLNAIHEFNTSIVEEGGATKVGIRVANSHAKAIGLDELSNMTRDWKNSSAEELKAARAARQGATNE